MAGYFCTMKWLLAGFLFCFGLVSFAHQQPQQAEFEHGQSAVNEANDQLQVKPPKSKKRKKRKKRRREFKRGVAALLCLFLGPFGVHRLYLGTSEKVPILYTITLGGLMVIPLVDLFLILFKKDKDSLTDNEKVIMW